MDTKIAGLLALQNSVAILYKEDHRENVKVFYKATGLFTFAMGHWGLAHRFGRGTLNWSDYETLGEVRC